MAKRKVFWHLGPAGIDTAFLPQALEALDSPADSGVLTVSAAEAADADLDLRRAHASAGRRRKSVDGAWARVEDKVWKKRGIWLLSTPAASLATPDRIQLARDGLRGIEVHFVFLRTDPALELEPLLRAWAQPLHPERVHVVDTSADPAAIWRDFLGVAGLAHPLPAGVVTVAPGTPESELLQRAARLLDPGRPDLARIATELVSGESPYGQLDVTARALVTAAEEIAQLRADRERLQEDIARLDRKRRKHKRRLKELTEASSAESSSGALVTVQ